MAPRTEEQFVEIRNEKMQLIMKTALQLFANKGYASTSISQIAKVAGISKGLMYNYFSSKEALLMKVVISGMENFMHFLEIEDLEKIRKEELIQFIDGNIKSLKENPDYYKLFFSLVFQPKVNQLLEPELVKIFEQAISQFTLYFQQQGEPKPYVKTRFILALFDGVGIHYISDIDHFPIDDVHRMIIKML